MGSSISSKSKRVISTSCAQSAELQVDQLAIQFAIEPQSERTMATVQIKREIANDRTRVWCEMHFRKCSDVVRASQQQLHGQGEYSRL